MQIRTTVVGAPELERQFKAMGDRAADVLEAAATSGGLVIEDAAKEKVSKRTRTLARSITTVTVEKSKTRVIVETGPQEPYGKYVEFGTGIYAEGGDGRKTPWRYKAGDGSWVTTRGQKPKPYMRPAYDEKKDEARREVADALLEAVTA